MICYRSMPDKNAECHRDCSLAVPDRDGGSSWKCAFYVLAYCSKIAYWDARKEKEAAAKVAEMLRQQIGAKPGAEMRP